MKIIADLSIPLNFNGPQPNAYGVEPARSKPVEAGDLIGDTRRGGSVNFEQYTFIPHCNGTHTECVGHITHDRIAVRDCLRDVIMPALLVSVEPEEANGDRLITHQRLESAIGQFRPPAAAGGSDALIVRTLPNDESKLTRSYGEENIPPYFTADAIRSIVDAGYKHLLVDLPSIDRIFDDGRLIAHRLFWNIDEESFQVNDDTRSGSTITEMIFVPNEIADGNYLLNLQIAPFASDCAPSRPLLVESSN